MILVNRNQWELTRHCVDSVRSSEGIETRMFLVDNASSGPVPEWAENSEDIVLSLQDDNLGFTGGNNLGFEMSRTADPSDYTLFLNNDAEVAPGTIEMLVRFMESHPDAGIAAPPVFLASAPDRVWSAGGEFLPWKMRFRQDIWPDRASLPVEPVETDFVSGCALMIRSGLFREMNGFRRDFFIYFEDAELCTRVRRAGRSVWFVPCEGVIHHVSSTSGGELTPFPVYFTERNRIVLSREMLSFTVRMLFEVYITAVLLVKTVKFLLWQGAGLVPWIWRGFIDGHTGRMRNRDILKLLSEKRGTRISHRS